MKKVLHFVFNTGVQNLFNAVLATSLLVGMILSTPALWMGAKYDSSWMNSTAPYFFAVFFACSAVIVFLFAPYAWYVSTSETYKGDGKGVLKSMAIFLSIIPGGVLYGFIAKEFLIPNGLHNIVGALLCGIPYLWMTKTALRKPFMMVQEFLPLT